MLTVTIAGTSKSGKTTLANAIAQLITEAGGVAFMSNSEMKHASLSNLSAGVPARVTIVEKTVKA